MHCINDLLTTDRPSETGYLSLDKTCEARLYWKMYKASLSFIYRAKLIYISDI
jgi:hypothetical protein